MQSALDPAGPQAAASQHMFQVMLPIAIVIYLVVVAVLLLIASRRIGPADPRDPRREAKAGRVITGGVVGTAVILLAVLLIDFSVARGLTRPLAPRPEAAIQIRVTGHQWWWEVEYQDSVAQRRVYLANEIHVPVGQPVLVELVSHDVIHSFWVPNLAGKKDLIPGHPNHLWIRADRAGRYRGECAEFCGLEHAKMGFTVVAEPAARFGSWLAEQRSPAAAPSDSLAAAGRVLFESGPCAACHMVSGTLAGGRVGPNLTHVASRLTLAAGALPNTRGHLAGWIVDPQTPKPGVLMPPTALAPAQLRALLAYLSTLR